MLGSVCLCFEAYICVYACSNLSAEHDIEVVRRLPLSVDVLAPDVAVVRHAVSERPDLGVRPVFCQREGVLQEVDLFPLASRVSDCIDRQESDRGESAVA